MTDHVGRVRQMMQGFGQDGPDKPCVPSEAILRLRCKLIFEEALEFVNACGFDVLVGTTDGFCLLSAYEHKTDAPQVKGNYCFKTNGKQPDLTEMVDGIADISVVNNGSGIALGIDMSPVLEIVDNNNLEKIATGRKCPETGKFLKSPDHKPPTTDIAAEIRRQQLA